MAVRRDEACDPSGTVIAPRSRWGRVEFDASIQLDGRPDVYRPSDDSYLLLASLALVPSDRFLEVGTGTGLVALHASRIARAVATDVNPAAVRLARDNARRNGAPLSVVRCDLASALRGPFDVIAFNPPYLEGSPSDALDAAWAGGKEGSEVAVRFLEDLPRILAPGGRAYLLLRRTNEAAWSLAHDAFQVDVIASKPLFFETLHVLELRREG